MTVYGALNPKSDVDLVYLPRQKEEEDWLAVKCV